MSIKNKWIQINEIKQNFFVYDCDNLTKNRKIKMSLLRNYSDILANKTPLFQRQFTNNSISSESEYPSNNDQNKEQPFVFNNEDEYKIISQRYHQENLRIRQDNQNLKAKISEIKKREQNLQVEIERLEKIHRKLTNNQKINQNKQNLIANSNSNSYAVSQVSSFKGALSSVSNSMKKNKPQAQLPFKNLFIDSTAKVTNLNDEFCSLVEESLGEKDPNKKKQIRKELAQLASKLKKHRSLEQKQDEYGLCKKQNKKQEKFSCSDLALAPYLINISQKRLQNLPNN